MRILEKKTLILPLCLLLFWVLLLKSRDNGRYLERLGTHRWRHQKSEGGFLRDDKNHVRGRFTLYFIAAVTSRIVFFECTCQDRLDARMLIWSECTCQDRLDARMLRWRRGGIDRAFARSMPPLCHSTCFGLYQTTTRRAVAASTGVYRSPRKIRFRQIPAGYVFMRCHLKIVYIFPIKLTSQKKVLRRLKKNPSRRPAPTY